MIKFDELENLTLHRQAISFPRTVKNKGMAVILNTQTLQQSMDFVSVKKRFLNMKYILSYYMPYHYLFKAFGKTTNEKIDNSDNYDLVEKQTKLTKFYRNLENYQTNNIYYDMSKYNEFFLLMKDKVKGDKVIKSYITLLNDISTQCTTTGYTKQLMVIDLLTWAEDIKSPYTYMYNNANTPFKLIYAALVRALPEFQTLKMDILLILGNSKIKIVPSMCDIDSAKTLKQLIVQMKVPKSTQQDVSQNVVVASQEQNAEERQETLKIDATSKIEKKINNIVPLAPIVSSFTGNTTTLEDDVAKKVEEVSEEFECDPDEDDDCADGLAKKTEEALNNDEEFLSKLDLVTTDVYTNISANNMKRNQILMEKQSKVTVNGKTIDTILKDTKGKVLEPKKIKTKTLNTDMQEMKFPNLGNSYNTNLLEKDTVAILNFFKSKRLPVYILDIQKEDTSDTFDKKFTYTVKMESADRQRHTLKFDMPKFVDNSFLYIGGSKWNILNQFFLKPVSKTAPDTVQLCSNYNKIFLTRTGTKVSPKIEKFKKVIIANNGVNIRSKLFFKTGDSSLANSGILSTIEYDDLSKTILDLYVNNGKYHFYFNQNNIKNFAKENNIKLATEDELLPVGIVNRKEIIYLNVEKDKIVGSNLGLVDFINDKIEEVIPNFKKDFANTNVGKKYIYGQATIMNRKIPVLLLLAYLEGLTTTLKKSGINYYFSDNRDRLKDDEKGTKEVVEFADGFLIYDKYPMRNSLLLNAFSIIPTKVYNYSAFDNKETYLEIFEELYGDKKILNAFENFYDLFIDPITLEVLQDLKLPTDFVSLTLFGNSLLEDNQFIKENSMKHYRVRNNELVNVYLYKALADSYSIYRSSAGNKHPQKMSIPQDKIIKDVVMSQIVENYSTLNPILEAEKLRASTFKGPSGF